MPYTINEPQECYDVTVPLATLPVDLCNCVHMHALCQFKLAQLESKFMSLPV